MTNWSNSDIQRMRRAIELASKGEGFVAPNPMVGCVIAAANGRIIGEGWHEQFGQSHAEVNAHRSIQDEDLHLLPDSSWYVTLEPCNHQGKTPACSGLIESISPKRLVISASDTNPNVNGGGIERLRKAGIEVEVGCLEKEVRWQNRRFFCNADKQRSYVVLKWAQSSDGFMDPRSSNERTAGSGGRAITGLEATPITHKWRAQEMGIAVGVGTAVIDEPELTVRFGHGKSPRAIIIDPQERLPTSHPLLERKGLDQTLHVCRGIGKEPKHKRFWNPEDGLLSLMQKLWKQDGISSILVEGGANTLQHFLSESMWDEVKVWTASHDLNGGLKAPSWPKEAAQPPYESGSGFAGEDRWEMGIRPQEPK